MSMTATVAVTRDRRFSIPDRLLTRFAARGQILLRHRVPSRAQTSDQQVAL
jgi:hypothetical protein